jgi:hypothetical protein
LSEILASTAAIQASNSVEASFNNELAASLRIGGFIPYGAARTQSMASLDTMVVNPAARESASLSRLTTWAAPPLTASGRIRRAPTRIIVVVTGPNPSFDYYLAPRLDGEIQTEVRDIADVPASSEVRTTLAGAFVLFCRHVSGAWLRAVESCEAVIAGVGIFVDDDIDELAADRTVPLWYRLRLWRLHLMHRRRLAQISDVLFVASDALATRNVAARPILLTPVADARDTAVVETKAHGFRVAFHATSVHASEHRWIRPIIGNVLEAEVSLSFEVSATAPLSFQWRGLPRTTIVPTVPWARYCTDNRGRHADLLLAPLLSSAANTARSWTKRIDAARLGAALLVSDPDVYQISDEERRLGMCVPTQPAAWVAAIRELSHDRDRLVRLRDLNRRYVIEQSEARGPSLAKLLSTSRAAEPVPCSTKSH